MIDNQKIKIDFLKLMGNENPSKDDINKLQHIPNNQLLKPLINDLIKKGVSLRSIAIRYNVSFYTIGNIAKVLNT